MLTLVQAVLASSERTDLRQFIGELQEKEIILGDESPRAIALPKIAQEKVFHLFPDLMVEPMTVQELLDSGKPSQLLPSERRRRARARF